MDGDKRFLTEMMGELLEVSRLEKIQSHMTDTYASIRWMRQIMRGVIARAELLLIIIIRAQVLQGKPYS
jgi:hypothetical protein